MKSVEELQKLKLQLEIEKLKADIITAKTNIATGSAVSNEQTATDTPAKEEEDCKKVVLSEEHTGVLTEEEVKKRNNEKDKIEEEIKKLQNDTKYSKFNIISPIASVISVIVAFIAVYESQIRASDELSQKRIEEDSKKRYEVLVQNSVKTDSIINLMFTQVSLQLQPKSYLIQYYDYIRKDIIKKALKNHNVWNENNQVDTNSNFLFNFKEIYRTYIAQETLESIDNEDNKEERIKRILHKEEELNAADSKLFNSRLNLLLQITKQLRN